MQNIQKDVFIKELKHPQANNNIIRIQHPLVPHIARKPLTINKILLHAILIIDTTLVNVTKIPISFTNNDVELKPIEKLSQHE